jgi:Dolichyl-phosphate-mannose-protein mannosyltransferase
MRTRESEPFSSRDVAAIALIGIVWTVLAFAIDPRGDFPLHDDWGYGLPVKALVERGEFRLTDWSNPTLVAQMLWGALFCLPAGFSFTAVRISTLVLGLFGVIGMYGLLRQLGAKRTIALFGAGVVGANPIYLVLSYTFMTDIPFLSVMIGSIFLLSRGMARDSEVSIGVGLGLALLSVLIRQIGLAIFFGFVVAYPFWRGLGRKWFLQAVVPAVLAFVALKAYERGLIAAERMPRIYPKYNEGLSRSFRELAHELAQLRLGALMGPIMRVRQLLIYLGLFTVPFSLLLWPSSLSRLSRRGRIVELGWVGGLTVLLTAWCVFRGSLMPVGPYILVDFGLGFKVGLSGKWPGPAPTVVALGMTVLSVLGAILVLQALARVAWRVLVRPKSPEVAAWRPVVVLLIATGAFYFGPLAIADVAVYDRYYLPVVPIAIALVWQSFDTTVLSAVPRQAFRLRPIGIAAGLLSLLLLLVYSAAGTHDYLDWNRERWSAVRRLAGELAIPPTEIDGGWEYNKLVRSEEGLYMNYQERGLTMTPREREGLGLMDDEVLDKPYRIAVSPATGYEVIRRVPLSPWLPLAPIELILMKRAGTSSPAK